MKFCDILSEELIIPDLQQTEKTRVLEELVSHLSAAVEGINAGELLAEAVKRLRGEPVETIPARCPQDHPLPGSGAPGGRAPPRRDAAVG
jgi:hypothetical protein